MTPNTNDTHTHEETGTLSRVVHTVILLRILYVPFAMCLVSFKISFVPKLVSLVKAIFGNNPTGLKFVSYQFLSRNTVVLGWARTKNTFASHRGYNVFRDSPVWCSFLIVHLFVGALTVRNTVLINVHTKQPKFHTRLMSSFGRLVWTRI